jgi:excisionase family DNA binding protein
MRKVVPKQNFVTVTDIADYCSVSTATVRRWVVRGELKASKLPSGHCRVVVHDFVEFLRRWKLPVPDVLSTLDCSSPKSDLLS